MWLPLIKNLQHALLGWTLTSGWYIHEHRNCSPWPIRHKDRLITFIGCWISGKVSEVGTKQYFRRELPPTSTSNPADLSAIHRFSPRMILPTKSKRLLSDPRRLWILGLMITLEYYRYRPLTSWCLNLSNTRNARGGSLSRVKQYIECPRRLRDYGFGITNEGGFIEGA